VTDENGNQFGYDGRRAIFDRVDRRISRDAEREPRRTTLIAKPPAHIEAAELELDAAEFTDLEADSEADRREREQDLREYAADQLYDQQRDDRMIGGEL
jgi:hypothetical protein